MALIGALIGGVTNLIAIKMLFRPYKPLYIGSWRLPFTPGVIPKRRDELASQLGSTIVEHLLTPESFRKRFLNAEMHQKTENWIQRQLQKYVFNSPNSFNDWLASAGQENMQAKAEAKLDELVDLQYASIRKRIAGKTVGDLMPDNWKQETDQKIWRSVKYAVDRGSDYFSSVEGRRAIKVLLDEFFATRGRFGNMLHSLLGESTSLVDRIQSEIIKFLNSPKTFELLASLVYEEWEKLQEREADKLLSEFDLEPAVDSIKEYVREKADIPGRLNATLAETWPRGLEWTGENFTPLVTDFIFQQGELKMEETMQKINIEGMVKEQVDSLPLSRMEELVLGISRKEFKMITVLGAFLGGLIGIIQGLLVTALNLM
ncbi:DUF445 family protein [Planococcus salinus]|uniref:DUF445 family protein n=2 Tax=Planococcus salinus TaxID=1848460 RepID=A0A3M8P707_9BACL|nr:DUF445 family protein [Planococcus salinus]